MAQIKINKRPTTKDELVLLVRLWSENDVNDIMKRLDRNRNWINGMALRLRKAGIKLPRKNRNGYLAPLIEEVARESK